MKKTPKQMRIRTYSILAVGILILFLSIHLNENVKAMLSVVTLGVLTIMAAFIHHIIFNRCPHCGK